MRDEYGIPPLRDLPDDRLAERKRHLVAEIAHPSLRRRIPPRAVLVLVAALVVFIGTATAFGTVRTSSPALASTRRSPTSTRPLTGIATDAPNSGS